MSTTPLRDVLAMLADAPVDDIRPTDTRLAERADLLAYLDGDLPVDLDAYTVMRIREAVREGEHLGAVAESAPSPLHFGGPIAPGWPGEKAPTYTVTDEDDGEAT